MTTPIDWTKPVQTRDGRPARVLCTDRKSELMGVKQVVALITDPDGEERMGNFWENGRYMMDPNVESPNDLINTPATIKGWVNWYQGDSGKIGPGPLYPNKEYADIMASKNRDRIACTYVEFKEGGGL